VSVGSTLIYNWGDHKDIGLDLSGAVELVFRARAERGTADVEFFCFGADGEPAKQVLKVGGLPDSWGTYRIAISPDRLLRNVLIGFGWVCSGSVPQVFFLDSIEFKASRLEEPRFIASYELPRPVKASLPSPSESRDEMLRRKLAEHAYGLDTQLRSTAFVYDNALALMVFLVAGETKRARLLAEAFRSALAEDRALFAKDKDRRLPYGAMRNAQSAGENLTVPGPDGRRVARLPGFWNTESKVFQEDHYSVSINTGNLAWVALALLAHADLSADRESFSAARAIADWVIGNCRPSQSPDSGFSSSFEGWEYSQSNLGGTIPCATDIDAPWGQCQRLYVAVEHQVDLYPLFRRLFAATGEPVYNDAADRAKRFVDRVWDLTGGRYLLAGTDDCGRISVPLDDQLEDEIPIPLDIHAWAVLAFRGDGARFLPGIRYVEAKHQIRVGPGAGGYGFKQSINNCFGDHTWYEGTSQLATAYRALGDLSKWAGLVDLVRRAQLPTGALSAASGDGLDTGFSLFSFYPSPVVKCDAQPVAAPPAFDRCTGGDPWLYFSRPHIGATAWFALCSAREFINPYWLGAPKDLS